METTRSAKMAARTVPPERAARLARTARTVGRATSRRRRRRRRRRRCSATTPALAPSGTTASSTSATASARMGTPVRSATSATWAPTATIAVRGTTCRHRHLRHRLRHRRRLRRRRRPRRRLRHLRPRRPCFAPTSASPTRRDPEVLMQTIATAKMGRTMPSQTLARTARTARTAGRATCRRHPRRHRRRRLAAAAAAGAALHESIRIHQMCGRHRTHGRRVPGLWWSRGEQGIYNRRRADFI